MNNLKMVPQKIAIKCKEIFDVVKSTWFRLADRLIGQWVDKSTH